MNISDIINKVQLAASMSEDTDRHVASRLVSDSVKLIGGLSSREDPNVSELCSALRDTVAFSALFVLGTLTDEEMRCISRFGMKV